MGDDLGSTQVTITRNGDGKEGDRRVERSTNDRSDRGGDRNNDRDRGDRRNSDQGREWGRQQQRGGNNDRGERRNPDIFKGRQDNNNNSFRGGRVVNNNLRNIVVPKVDRKKKCPFLIRVFPSHGEHNGISSYQNGSVPKEELAIYTWQDTKLKDIAELVKQNYPDANKEDVLLRFSRVYPDGKTGDWTMTEIGRIGNKVGKEDYLALIELGWNIGDLMDVAVVVYENRQARERERRFQ
jgi:hypothetical protein